MRNRTIHLPPVVVEAFKRQRQAFREKFGREPGADDPIFFDPMLLNRGHCLLCRRNGPFLWRRRESSIYQTRPSSRTEAFVRFRC
jgi:hypothetical protein